MICFELLFGLYLVVNTYIHIFLNLCMNPRLQAQYSWLLSILEDLKRAVLYLTLPNILPLPSVVAHIQATRGKKPTASISCMLAHGLFLSPSSSLFTCTSFSTSVCLPCLTQTPITTAAALPLPGASTHPCLLVVLGLCSVFPCTCICLSVGLPDYLSLLLEPFKVPSSFRDNRVCFL